MDHRRILIFTISTICYINCSPYNMDVVMRRNRPLCGDRLKNALSLVCNQMYAPGKTNKKSVSDDDLFNYEEYQELDENYENDARQYDYPFLRKENIMAMLKPHQRKRDGIVSECCHKACTEAHMRLYCLNSD